MSNNFTTAQHGTTAAERVPEMTIGVFLLCLLLYSWFVHKATQHRKDPDKVFYLGNVAPAGRKYVWLALLAFVLAIIVFFWSDHG